MYGKRKLITFDWAIKRLLRSKANFDILEGFLSELLKEEVSILEVLESESNKENRRDKFNRVDLKVTNSKEEIFIIEVQYDREFDYLQRILYATSKAITEQMQERLPYSKVTKVISVNIIYFDLGSGSDYVYHGTTSFTGLHTHDQLRFSPKQQQFFGKNEIYQVFPEYYLIRINSFDDVARDGLDEWIYFLKNEEIKDGFKAKGLQQAKQKLDILKLPEQERHTYERYVDDLRYQASMFESSYGFGHMDGRKEGQREGKKEGQRKGEGSLLLRQLHKRFGLLSAEIEEKIDSATESQLQQWGDLILEAKTLDDVFQERSSE